MNSYHTKRETKGKINKSDFIKIKKYAAKDNINKVKSDSTTKRQTVQYKTWQRTWIDTSLKMIYKYLITGKILRIPNHAQFSSVAQSCLTHCDPMNHSVPGLLVHHQLPEFTQTHVHWAGDAIQPTHPPSSPSPPTPNPSQHQSLFQWVNSSYEVAKVLEFKL